MQAPLWVTAATFAGAAVLANVAERRRSRRAEPDRVGWVPWPLVQFLALLAAIMIASVALHGRG